MGSACLGSTAVELVVLRFVLLVISTMPLRLVEGF